MDNSGLGIVQKRNGLWIISKHSQPYCRIYSWVTSVDQDAVMNSRNPVTYL